MQSSKTFRVFISSTFNDLKIERDVLQNEVFPEIQEYCESKGYRFQVIDLRWGVSNEAGLDHRAMKICLDEVKRSLSHPKPNLIVLMGDRYGWIPLPAGIEEQVFEKLVDEIVPEEEKDLLSAWYRLDTNTIPAQYILQPIQEILKINDPTALTRRWQYIEKKLLWVLQNSAKQCSDIDSRLFFTSATEQEIRNGVLDVSDPNRVLVLDRYITNKDDITDPDLLEIYYEKESEDKLIELKEELQNVKQAKYYLFQTELQYTQLENKEKALKIKKDFLDEYVEKTKTFLKENIDLEIKRINALEEQVVEYTHHEIFMKERSHAFIGRDQSIAKVRAYIADNNTYSPYILYGESGVGKSALMAKIVTEMETPNLIYRFIGITEKSSVPILFLNDLIYEIEIILGQKHNTAYVQNEYDEVVNRFRELLTMFSNRSQLVIIIDALDQFTEHNKLEWLEEKLPKNVKIIISTLPGGYLNLLVDKALPENFEEIKKLTVKDGRKILESWLVSSHRTLQKLQFDKILTNFKENGLPLYLKIAFEESLHWHSYTDEIVLDETLEGIIHGYINRLIEREYHSKELVEHVLGYISASKNGLSEDELYEILSADKVVMQAISNPRHKIQPVENVPKLPAAIWARFYADLIKHLSFTNKDNTQLLNFYHRKITETVRDFYYAPDKHIYHAKLIEYFLTQPSDFQDENARFNLRKNAELPYQLAQSNAYKLFVEYYDLDVLHVKSERKHISQALLELHNMYNAIDVSLLNDKLKSKLQNKLCEILIAYLITRIKQTDSPRLSVESIHASYVYRDEKKYYNQILEMANNRETLKKIYLQYENEDSLDEENILRYFIAFRARYSNKIRRETKLEVAFMNYEGLVTDITKNRLEQEADYNELSKIQYDMGYIKYLQGDFDSAINYMSESIKSCDLAKNPINAAISQCLQYRIGFLSGKYLPDEFDAVLDDAYEVFYENRLKNSNAKRWVRNVLAHKFEVAYSKKDLKESTRLFEKFKNDDWRLEFKNENKFTNDQADCGRVLILQGRYEKAVQAFRIYIFSYLGSLKVRQKREAVARDYYDYLLALKRKGDMKEFEKV